eukprot:scaffold14778_cov151-Skeletonema_dohrnii-CCMP3373.AAC.4
MTLLKLFNASNANSPKDDVGGSNAQLESKGRDQRPSPPKDDGDVGSKEAATLRGSSSASFLPFKAVLSLACRGILVLALLVVGKVGIVKYNRAPAPAAGRILQQETLFVADNRGGKAGKVPSLVCDSPIKCGHTVTGTGEELSLLLLEDVVCTEPSPSTEACAITISGEGAELDCNNFMITQTQDTSNSNSWKYGICASNGAKAMNCHVGGFGNGNDSIIVGAGIRIQNGGEIEDSEVMFNVAAGILVEGSEDSTTKISDTFVHDNGFSGIKFEGESGSESSIQIEGVRSINNGRYGMYFSYDEATLNLRVKDSETSYNEGSGFYATTTFTAGGYVDFEVEGFFNSRYNEDSGMGFLNFSPLEGEMKMKVKGVVNIYKNRLDGLYMGSGVNVALDKRGALNSCSNDDQDGSGFYKDIYNDGSGTFSGDGYTCGTIGVADDIPGGTPNANLPAYEDNSMLPFILFVHVKKAFFVFAFGYSAYFTTTTAMTMLCGCGVSIIISSLALRLTRFHPSLSAVVIIIPLSSTADDDDDDDCLFAIRSPTTAITIITSCSLVVEDEEEYCYCGG